MKSNIEKYFVEHLAIRALIDGYNDIVNNRNWEAIPQIFATKSIWKATAPVNLQWEGIEEIKIELPKSAERMEVLIQSSSGVVIEVINRNQATVRSLMSEFGRSTENGEGFHAVCTYHDVVIIENGNWKFKTRSLELKYFDTLPVPGNISGYKY